jgi:hypothetical protein
MLIVEAPDVEYANTVNPNFTTTNARADHVINPCFSIRVGETRRHEVARSYSQDHLAFDYWIPELAAEYSRGDGFRSEVSHSARARRLYGVSDFL